MTKYLTNYMSYISDRLDKACTYAETDDILAEHKDKILFMQHERIVHFLVTMMFALILVIFVSVQFFTDSIGILLLIIMLIVLMVFYIKHYYFLENTVQKMYVIYDEILKKQKMFREDIE